ncbi:LysR substrate-binding domain-containing protein [Sorangium sp. So ce341]|uniref:LysR family transcriptional regulator n=1 Tax=Sorangium sp. So ce341 TaxID=3133302 RepID=UPI003F5F0BE5
MRKQFSAIEMLDLQLFAAVVEQRSFSAAARAHSTTTSAASKRIARLEDRLGVSLFERNTRRVLPTEAGSSFYAYAARILSDLGEAENEISTLGGKPRGTLRVSAPLLLGERHLVPLLAGFLARYPEVRVEVALGDAFVNLLADRFDVALRVGALVDSSLVRVKVGDARAVIVASPAYLERAGSPESPRDLTRHVCLRAASTPAAQEWRFRSNRGEMSVSVTGNLILNHGGGLREAAIAGAGIARLPDFLIADALESGELVELLAEHAIKPIGIHLVHLAHRRPLPKVEAFVSEVGSTLKARLRSLHA